MEGKIMNTKISFNILPGYVITAILYGILAWFVYDKSFNAALGVFILSVVITVVIIVLSCIPVIGWIAAIVISWFWMVPELLIIIGIEWTWLITCILLINIFTGLIITGVTTIAAIILIGTLIGAILS